MNTANNSTGGFRLPILEGVLLDIMYELPSLDNVSKVVVDESVIEGEAEPFILYENQPKQAAASE